MLEHQRAADEMPEGLFIPSESQWIHGARRLAAAPLHAPTLPRDGKLTSEIRQAEDRVHRIAECALTASIWEVRAEVYAQVLTTCAGCHG
jgi:hypothetical protein